MSICKSYFAEKFIEGYVNSPFTLKEHALINVAIQFCYTFKLKRYILCMSKSMERYKNYCNFDNKSFMDEWDESIVKQLTIMCKDLVFPHELEVKLIARTCKIALQMLSWSKQWQIILNVPRDFIDHLLLPSDWTAEVQLNEIQVAEHLVQDEKIAAYNRYKIACLYCLEPFIFSLCQEIGLKPVIISHENRSLLELLVSELSGLLTGVEEVNVHRRFWDSAFLKAVKAGEKTAVVYCWNKLSEHEKQNIAISAAHSAVRTCYDRKVLRKTRADVNPYIVPVFPLRHYEDILCFLLSQMTEEQITALYELEFGYDGFILECMLEWSHQEYFVPIITKLWPENIYGNALLKLAQKYTNTIENQEYNYGSLLIELMQRSPESYKRYIFSIKYNDQGEAYSEGAELILILIKKQPLDYGDIRILQFILEAATPEEKQSIMHLKSGIPFCESLILDGNLTLVHWVLTQCLPEDMIVNFKKEFFLSEKGYYTCFRLLKDGKLDQINTFLGWISLSTEISEFRSVLFFEKQFQSLYRNLIWIFQIDPLDRILQWCLPSKEDQNEYKKHLIKKSGKRLCINFLRKGKCAELQQFLIWCLASEENVQLFKKEIFPKVAEKVHYYLVSNGQWQKAKLLFKWFQLSPEQIKQFKKDTLFNAIIPKFFNTLLKKDGCQRIGRILSWCCFDEDTVLAFKAELQQICHMTQINQNSYMLQILDLLVKARMCDLERKREYNTQEMKERESKKGNSPPMKRMRKKK